MIALGNIRRALIAAALPACVCSSGLCPAFDTGRFDIRRLLRDVGADRLDLPHLLITWGFAFAAILADGLPQQAPYAVIEQNARKKRAGLWQFSDVQHPAIVPGRARQTTGLGQ